MVGENKQKKILKKVEKLRGIKNQWNGFLEEIYKSCDITKSNKENRQIANGKVLKNIPGY